MTIVAERRVHGRSLVSDDLFDRLVEQIVKDGHADRRHAVRIMDQALAFLRACANNSGVSLRPSKAVDIGWHTFVLFTRDYAEFCARVAGRFLHHVPEEFNPPDSPAMTLSPTMDAIRAAGMILDTELWAQGSADCSQCHGGCTECGQSGPGV